MYAANFNTQMTTITHHVLIFFYIYFSFLLSQTSSLRNET